MAMNSKEGRAAVVIARKAVDLWVTSGKRLVPKDYPESFDVPAGVFVTIHTYPGRELRGCIGFPEPVLPLIKGLVEAAVASTRDPRFPEMGKDELGSIIIEVSVLTRPEPIRARGPEGYLRKIRTGKDGLIVRKGHHSGLLLPQVAKEHGLGREEFLSHTCIKAGLSPDAWKEGDLEIFRFQSLVFSEKEPGRF